MQRNYDTFGIPAEIEPSEISPKSDGVEITWNDSHKSYYPWSWFYETLTARTNDRALAQSEKKLWGASIENTPPEVPFESVVGAKDSNGLAELTDKIRAYGLCFVTNTPATPEASEKLLETIGPIRNTHYGGFYDFVPDLALADTAYTNLALAAHTDTTYFTEPAGLQAFHLLSHTPPPNQRPEEALGGQSLLVDGFHAASVLKQESPEDYETLRRVKVPWHASGNQGVAIAPDRAYPVIEEDSTLRRIRWNNDDRGVIPLDVDVNQWYRAARKWNEILTRKDSEYWFQLTPGRMLIFDNWRVLHGRSAFEGLRRICGGYINRDDFISRWKTSNFERDECWLVSDRRLSAIVLLWLHPKPNIANLVSLSEQHSLRVEVGKAWCHQADLSKVELIAKLEKPSRADCTSRRELAGA
ncbi:trimethyllysine dioxygenase [Cordyceps militaris CM01]|uniref:Trimethyllysine dioxygenase n=1 Tax=Cordyceps militaris (strain CM01) TaxID=983644 RepID=G3JQH1_CORMM|nr:trimethyllysine dioxygenase [Cordyceps militaris CM01]EGX89475.1 trimethyllysine dioxygenase [Cordyceps militaris CM01]